MKKLKFLANRAPVGLVIYCSKCVRYNPQCNHYDRHEYRARIHIAGTKNSKRIKTLTTRNFDEAVIETIQFKQEMESTGFQKTVVIAKDNEHSLQDAIVLYGRFLRGEYDFAHLKKNVSPGHVKEQLRFVMYFARIVKKRINLSALRVAEVNQHDVSNFYSWASPLYAPRTFNKMFQGLRAFFDFVIKIENVEMQNPFASYQSKALGKGENKSLTKEEFEAILHAVDTANPIKKLGGKGENKSMFRTYLKTGWRLLLCTGARREEVVMLKWNTIFQKGDLLFFALHNLKVERAKDGKKEVMRYVPIGADLLSLLIELGFEEKKGSDDYILHPNRTESPRTIMDVLSKSFSFYKDAAGVQSNVSMKNLRKTYISWIKATLNTDARLITSHSSHEILETHYLDQTILSAMEKAVLQVRIFGD